MIRYFTHAKSGYDYARLRDGDVLTSCGRVGSEKYLEALATIQRRDKIEHLRNAIASPQPADKILPRLSEIAQPLASTQPSTA